jgi:hypothetical protein
MMPSSTAILESVARKGAQINRAPYNVETWNQPGLASAAKLVKIRNSQLRPMNSLRGGKIPCCPRENSLLRKDREFATSHWNY